MTAGWALVVFGAIWMSLCFSMAESTRDPKWVAFQLLGALACLVGILIP